MSLEIISPEGSGITIGVALAGALFSAAFSWLFARNTIPRAHRVAVIGFPQGGKTSLIVSLFAFYFRRGVRGASILPRGEETIRRVNEHIAEMESGKGVLPTTDQDLFAFRAEVQKNSVIPIFSRKYKLEIGDFPGEQSEAFINTSSPWLHNTSYFEWAMGADSFIFVIDASKAFRNENNFIAIQKSAFRAAWQKISEHHIDGSRNLRKKSAVLVFTKADLLVFSISNRSEVEKLKDSLDLLFADLIEYFSREIPRFRTVVTSVVSKDSDERIGVATVANVILPKLL